MLLDEPLNWRAAEKTDGTWDVETLQGGRKIVWARGVKGDEARVMARGLNLSPPAKISVRKG